MSICISLRPTLCPFLSVYLSALSTVYLFHCRFPLLTVRHPVRSILSALVRPIVCFLVRPFLPVHPKARTCMTRPSFLYSLHLTARADKRIHLLIFDKKCREFTTVAVTSKRTICECPDCPSVILPPALQHVLSTVCHCISLTSTFFFCIPVFPSLFVSKIHLSVYPIVYLHPHVLLYVLLSFFKLFVNPHFRPSVCSSLCHCVISPLFSQSPFLSINSG